MKILILTAGFGEGHNAAARNLRTALLELAGPGSAEVLDLVRLCYGRIGEMAQKGYLTLINHAGPLWQKIYEALDSSDMAGNTLPMLGKMREFLKETLDREKPDAVVSTWPLYSYLLEELFPEGIPRPFPFVTIVTDSITINSVWYRAPSDYFIVPNEQTREVMERAGVPVEKLRSLGFPVPLAFARAPIPKTAPAAGDPRRVLYMINSGGAEAPALVRRLTEIPDIALTVTVGRNNALGTVIEEVACETGCAIEIFGWTDRMPELLMRSHVFIGKAGGASVQEAIAACTPMIISHVVPGQEEGNARLIVENGCGAVAETHEEIAQAIERAFENNAQLWQSWYTGISSLSHPHAALEIAEFVLEKVGKAER